MQGLASGIHVRQASALHLGTVTQNAKLKITTPSDSAQWWPIHGKEPAVSPVDRKVNRNCVERAKRAQKENFCWSMFSSSVSKPSGASSSIVAK